MACSTGIEPFSIHSHFCLWPIYVLQVPIIIRQDRVVLLLVHVKSFVGPRNSIRLLLKLSIQYFNESSGIRKDVALTSLFLYVLSVHLANERK